MTLTFLLIPFIAAAAGLVGLLRGAWLFPSDTPSWERRPRVSPPAHFEFTVPGDDVAGLI